jgi:hypothetical protein
MPYYFYNQKNQSLPAWGNIHAGKILQKSDKEVLKINLIDSYHLEYKSDKIPGFTEILAESIPMSILSESLEFELLPDLKLEGENFKIHTKKFDPKSVDKFLNSKDVLFYNQNEDDWTIVKWELSDHQAKFWTLRTYKDQDLSLWTESFYGI